MNIISNYSKDTRTDKPHPGSYEWWYFDAQSVDGFKFVVIFYEGNPFSRRYIDSLKKEEGLTADQFPAISISVYKKNDPIFYSFREVKPEFAEYSEDISFGRVDKNIFEGQNHQARIEYNLQLDEKLASGDSVLANLLFSTDIQSLPAFSSSGESYPHTWNLIAPSCHVSGTIKIDGYFKYNIDFKGLGYHDHNLGFEPLRNSFKEWYWGRYHLENSTFVYYLMKREREETWQKKAWLISKNGMAETLEDIEISDFGYSIFGLKTARVLEAQADGKNFYLQLDELLDSGPFYQRFGGRLLVNSDGYIEEARGISEYIKPDRIYERKFWPLVNMRINYPGKPHWVQKNPLFYRWTW